MTFFGRLKRRQDRDHQYQEAQEALGKSLSDLKDIDRFRPVVEDTVRQHRKLQVENHFQERIDLAYRQR